MESRKEMSSQEIHMKQLLKCNVLCSKALRAVTTNIRQATSKSDAKSSRRAPESRAIAAQSALQIEAKLWVELKAFRDTKDSEILNFLNGFYVTLLQQVLINYNSSNDSYFVPPPTASSLQLDLSTALDKDRKDDAVLKYTRLLAYNTIIRIGDLNRYLNNINLAKSFYTQARHLNPIRGHAYNQLALLTNGDRVGLIYNYIRACRAFEEPVTIAETNLRSAVTKYAPIDELIRSLFSPEIEVLSADLKGVTNWLHVIVIAIFANNIRLIARPLLDKGFAWLQKQMGLNPFSSSEFENNLEEDSALLLPAIDVLLDFSLVNLGDKLPFLCDHENDLKQLKVGVTSLLSQSDNFAINTGKTALRHDYNLLGFAPLVEVHSKLSFESSGYEGSLAAKSGEFIILIKRIENKVANLLIAIGDTRLSSKPKPKGTPRNIALASIMANR